MMKTPLLFLPLLLAGLFRSVQSEPAAEPRTTFVPSLLSPFDSGKNTLWCGTSAISWKALIESAGDEVDREALQGVAADLTADPFGPDSLASKNYVAVGGLKPAEVRTQAREQLAERFDGYKDPWLEENVGGPVHAYAYLKRALKFVHTFQDCSDTALVFGEGERAQSVESFGFRDLYSHKSHKLLHMQTRVLSYEGPDRFICKISTKESDSIVIARVKPAKNLALTWEAVVAEMRSKENNSSRNRARLHLWSGDHFVVPKVEFDLTHGFEGLNLPLREGVLALSARQTLRIRLDEKGADVESRNLRAGGMAERERKDMICDGPFLLAFLEKDAEWPYCMVWVANADLLVPCKEAAEPTSDE